MQTLRSVVRNSSKKELDYRYSVTYKYQTRVGGESSTKEVKTKSGISRYFNYFADEPHIDRTTITVSVYDMKLKKVVEW